VKRVIPVVQETTSPQCEEAVPQAFRIFVGYDHRQNDAYEVCKFSIEKRASIPVDVKPINIRDMRSEGLYWRADDPLASTEFTYTRFLVPELARFEGFALFCDCDFLWLSDVADLISLADRNKAVQCVHHQYQPKETVKMDGKPQSSYPRKNWSSLMLFNCDHPSTQKLTRDVVNRESGSYLHRFQWVDDNDIGSLPSGWNWLEGWDEPPMAGMPNAIHFTRGGPWYEQWKSVEYADAWRDEKQRMMQETSGARTS
jgi:lipopolysaccharide biosynthesis glycosyltransferase